MALPDELTTLEAVIVDFLAKYDVLVEGQVVFKQTTDLVADTTLTGTMADGSTVRVFEFNGFDLVKVANGLVHYTALSGAKFRLRMDRASPMMLGAFGDGLTDDDVALDLILGTDALEVDLQGRDYTHSGTWTPDRPVFNGTVTDTAGLVDYKLLTEARVATNAETAAGLPVTKVPTIGGVAALVQVLIDAIPQRNIVQTAFTGIALYAAATSIELTDLRTIITTLNAASKVMVKVIISCERANDGVFRITRNGVDVFQNTAASPGTRHIGIAAVNYDTDANSTLQTQAFEFLDTVGAAGSYEYRLHVDGSSAAFALNRTITDADNVSHERAASFLLLEEI